MKSDDIWMGELLKEFDFTQRVVGDAPFGDFGADFDFLDSNELGGIGYEMCSKDVGILTSSYLFAFVREVSVTVTCGGEGQRDIHP